MWVCGLSRGETEAEEAGGQHGPHTKTCFKKPKPTKPTRVEAEARTQISLISAELTAQFWMPRLSKRTFWEALLLITSQYEHISWEGHLNGTWHYKTMRNHSAHFKTTKVRVKGTALVHQHGDSWLQFLSRKTEKRTWDLTFLLGGFFFFLFEVKNKVHRL